MDSDRLWVPGGTFQPRRYHPGGIGNWSGHLPFACDLVTAVRPGLLVELGTHYGESYFGFCQAIAEHDIPCSAYAVDTWVGESHAGTYDESVFEDVNSYNTALYSRFSYLLRMTFDDAVSNFEDESIDILHIDGLHTFEAVSHDFHTWYPKVKPGGVVLLHDIMARHSDFGVWRLWAELKSLGRTFAFTHSWGLGVHCKTGALAQGRTMLETLFDSSEEYKNHIRSFYSLSAMKLENQHYSESKVRVPIQLFPYGPEGYSAETVINADVVSDTWQDVAIEVSSGTGHGPLRVDPADRPGLIDISRIALRSQSEDEVFWTADFASIGSLSAGGTMMSVTSEEPEYCSFLSFGTDPQLFLPSVERQHAHKPTILEMRYRIRTQFSSLLPLLTGTAKTAVAEQAEQAEEELRKQQEAAEEHRKQREALSGERDELIRQRASLLSEQDALIRERDSLLAALRKQHSELYVTKTDLKRGTAAAQELEAKLARVDGELKATRSELTAAQAKAAELEAVLQGVLASRSWRITAPMRGLIERLRASEK